MDPSSVSAASSLTRRRILGWGGAGAVGGIAACIGWTHQESATVTEVKPSSVAKTAGGLHRDDFLPHLKSSFQLDNGDRCTLVDVGTIQKLTSPTAEFISFSLLFTAPKDYLAESKVHQLSHAEMETLDLFISPVGDSKDLVYLEAICCQRI